MKSSVVLAATLLAGSAMPLAAAPPAGVTLGASLSGANEPAGGDADGMGSFTGRIDAEQGNFCYRLSVDKIATPTMAHIHTGAAGVNGPPVAAIAVTGTGGDECATIEPTVLKAIIANPAGYYVNVHTADFPGGAIRGQLAAK